MSKHENTSPFIIDMNISMEGLQNIPSGMEPAELFMNVAINSIVSVGKKNGGLRMEEHSKLKRIRDDMQNAIKVKEDKVQLEYDDYKFLMKCWNEHMPDPQTNELVIRVWEKLKQAQSDHDKGKNDEKETRNEN